MRGACGQFLFLTMHSFAKFLQSRPNGCGDIVLNGFHNDSRPPSWICEEYFGTTRKEYLVVLKIVQKLVGITSVVLVNTEV